MNTLELFSLIGKVAVITGGAGLLGVKHAEAILDAGGSAVLLDIDNERLKTAEKSLLDRYGQSKLHCIACDITKKAELESARDEVLDRFGQVDVLINNAANNPKVEGENSNWSRLENFSLDLWNKDFAVGVTGAFLCSQVFGTYMAKQKSGVIINVSSDLGIIAPDQRLYQVKGLSKDEQPVKPVTYSVVKHALLGLTKYLATYWADDNIRVNAICPGGVYNQQDETFLSKLQELIPLGRMATEDEYKGIIVYLASDASSYMTGSTISIDGGRTCW